MSFAVFQMAPPYLSVISKHVLCCAVVLFDAVPGHSSSGFQMSMVIFGVNSGASLVGSRCNSHTFLLHLNDVLGNHWSCLRVIRAGHPST